MVTTTPLMTAEELLNMPDDGFRYELVRGELRKRPLAGQTHGRLRFQYKSLSWRTRQGKLAG